MNDKELKAKVAKFLADELNKPPQWWYLSFAENRFLGGIIIYGHGVTDCLTRINVLDINPGRQVLAIPFEDHPDPPKEYCNRLLNASEVKAVFKDAKYLWEIQEGAEA